MGRFNKPIPIPIPTPASEKVRVCLFVDPDVYRRIKAQCVLDGTNVSRWFDQVAKDALTLGWPSTGSDVPAEPKAPRPKRSRKAAPCRT